MLINNINDSVPRATYDYTYSDCRIPFIDMTETAARRFAYFKFVAGSDNHLYYQFIKHEAKNRVRMRISAENATINDTWAVLPYTEKPDKELLQEIGLDFDSILSLYPYPGVGDLREFLDDDGYYFVGMEPVPFFLPEFMLDIFDNGENIIVRHQKNLDSLKRRLKYLISAGIYVYFISSNCKIVACLMEQIIDEL